jgi:CelD/BcsL family acetyltransferase involved in cellulose biosynthesis
MIRTAILEDLNTLYDIKDAWENLVSKSSMHWIYGLPEWSIAWLKSFSGEYRLNIALAWDGAELVGIMPLVETRGRAGNLFSNRLEPVSGLSADYQAPILKNGMEREIIFCLLDQIHRGRKLLLWWPNLPLDHPAFPLFREYFQVNSWPWRETFSACPRLMLPPTYQELEKSWKKKHRDDVKRQRHHLQKMGELTLEILEDPGSIDSWLQELFEVYSSKWRAEGQSSMFDNYKVRRYYKELTYQLASKGLHISSLRLNEKRISYHLGFLYEGWLYWYKPTYDREYHSFSPGKVHISMLMEHACSHGWQGFDFLQGEEPYKYQWAQDGLKCATFSVGINGGGFAFKWNQIIKPKLKYLKKKF